jgi:type II secretory pathway component PulK
MKTEFSICQRPRQGQGGSAVLVILILLFIMVIFVAANTATLNWLRRQVNAVDKHQTQRLALASTNQLRNAQAVTNQPLSK